MKPQRWHFQWWVGFDSTVYWQKNKNRLPNVGSVPFAKKWRSCQALPLCRLPQSRFILRMSQKAVLRTQSISSYSNQHGGDHDPYLLADAYGKPPSPLPSRPLATTLSQPTLLSLSGHWPAENHFCFSCKERDFYCPLWLFWLNLISGTRVPAIEFLIY